MTKYTKEQLQCLDLPEPFRSIYVNNNAKLTQSPPTNLNSNINLDFIAIAVIFFLLWDDIKIEKS